ncbi:biotin-dependent carboxyltransferase family protein [Agrilactobacillus fermenti]|uniref:5-oxoprolinase subunit C family protein n=1 Tax=Agrilactobacillus fermenti TaxID=2586909 RepID=UPI003A5BA22E
MNTIEILHPGLFTTIQDIGRPTHQIDGFSESGAIDQVAYQIGNLLLNNPDKAAALEYTGVAPDLQFNTESFIAITGAKLAHPQLNRHLIRQNTVYAVHKGDQLKLGPLASGHFGYLAIAGGIQTPKVLDSRSTTLKAQIGGLNGRTLRSHDQIPILPIQTMTSLKYRNFSWHSLPAQQPIRILPGPQWSQFTKQAQTQFLNQTYTITNQTDRMGYHLTGKPIATPTTNLLSQGTAFGNIQITRNGDPVVLLADRQTTGGYPVIATIAAVDRHRFVQNAPQAKIHFQLLTVTQATALWRTQQQNLQALTQSFHAMKYQPPISPQRIAAQKITSMIQVTD